MIAAALILYAFGILAVLGAGGRLSDSPTEADRGNDYGEN